MIEISTINIDKPAPFTDNIDDPTELDASIKRLDRYEIETVYPGHGKPFSFDELGVN